MPLLFWPGFCRNITENYFTHTQNESARLNEKLATEMTEMKERITSIEKILKEVE